MGAWWLRVQQVLERTLTTLKKITECVVSLDTADSATIKAFFKWVSASVKFWQYEG